MTRFGEEDADEVAGISRECEVSTSILEDEVKGRELMGRLNWMKRTGEGEVERGKRQSTSRYQGRGIGRKRNESRRRSREGEKERSKDESIGE